MSTEEVRYFERHLVSLVNIKSFADSLDQLCFQMERLWFYLFNCEASTAQYWFHESANKTLSINAFEAACRDLAQSLERRMVQRSKVMKLLSLSDSVRDCYEALKGKPSDGDACKDYYRVISEGEGQSLALSHFILSVFADIEQLATAQDLSSGNDSH